MKKKLIAIIMMVLAINVIGIESSAKSSIGNCTLENIKEALKDRVRYVSVLGENELKANVLKEMGRISVKEELRVGGCQIPLYATFDNREKALKGISGNKHVKLIMKAKGYEEINDNNWTVYQSALFELMESDSDIFSESSQEYNELQGFFDIYENYDQNDEIKKSIYNCKSFKDFIEMGAYIDLPEDSYNACDMIQKQNFPTVATVKGTIVKGFNVEKGCEYANKYAYNPNTSKYDYYSNSDCTNFVSQILENGGVKQELDKDLNVHKGWWHRILINNIGGTYHHHSHSWTVANTFARYMGVNKNCDSFKVLGKSLKLGDFIAYDKESDGDWNHMAFVTGVSTTMNKYGYYDVKIAQHTKNYNLWASSGDNNWENIGGKGGGRYARVRR